MAFLFPKDASIGSLVLNTSSISSVAADFIVGAEFRGSPFLEGDLAGVAAAETLEPVWILDFASFTSFTILLSSLDFKADAALPPPARSLRGVGALAPFLLSLFYLSLDKITDLLCD